MHTRKRTYTSAALQYHSSWQFAGTFIYLSREIMALQNFNIYCPSEHLNWTTTTTTVHSDASNIRFRGRGKNVKSMSHIAITNDFKTWQINVLYLFLKYVFFCIWKLKITLNCSTAIRNVYMIFFLGYVALLMYTKHPHINIYVYFSCYRNTGDWLCTFVRTRWTNRLKILLFLNSVKHKTEEHRSPIVFGAYNNCTDY